MAHLVRDVLIELFREGKPDNPVDIHWQNETFRDIFAQTFPEVAREAFEQVIKEEER